MLRQHQELKPRTTNECLPRRTCRQNRKWIASSRRESCGIMSFISSEIKKRSKSDICDPAYQYLTTSTAFTWDVGTTLVKTGCATVTNGPLCWFETIYGVYPTEAGAACKYLRYPCTQRFRAAARHRRRASNAPSHFLHRRNTRGIR